MLEIYFILKRWFLTGVGHATSDPWNGDRMYTKNVDLRKKIMTVNSIECDIYIIIRLGKS